MNTALAKTGSERAPAGTAPALLERLERLIDTELGPLRAGVEPLLEELRQGLAALHPGPGGQQLSPQRQQEQRTRLDQVLDTLEDILEALQRAARAQRHPGPAMGQRED